MAVDLRKLTTMSSLLRALSSGVVLRRKLSEEEITRRRCSYISDKLSDELNAVDDESLDDIDVVSATSYDELKSVLKYVRKLNRKNGVIPVPPPPPSRRRGGGGGLKLSGGGYNRNFYHRPTDDKEVMEMVVIAFEKYNKENPHHASSLEFVNVLRVDYVRPLEHGVEHRILIQARLAGVSIKLLAHCELGLRHRRLCSVTLYRPVSFMRVLNKDKTHLNTVPIMDLLHKDGSKKTGGVEALLYANLRDCPIINRRLGLKKKELHRVTSCKSVVKVSLDDDTVMRVAKFAVNQRLDLHFLRITEAWREKMKERRVLYHVILEAFGDGLTRRFYSSISTNSKGEAADLVDLVAVDCPRATIN